MIFVISMCVLDGPFWSLLGWRALHMAAIAGHKDIIELLLQQHQNFRVNSGVLTPDTPKEEQTSDKGLLIHISNASSIHSFTSLQAPSMLMFPISILAGQLSIFLFPRIFLK